MKTPGLRRAHEERRMSLNMLDNEESVMIIELTCLQYYLLSFNFIAYSCPLCNILQKKKKKVSVTVIVAPFLADSSIKY